MSFFTPSGLSVVANAESSGVANTPPYNWAHPSSNSTASGLYGFTDTTWKQYAPQAGVDTSQYPSAYLAPADVQTQVAAITPTSNWTCPGCDATVNAAIAADPALISSQPISSDGLTAGSISSYDPLTDTLAGQTTPIFDTGSGISEAQNMFAFPNVDPGTIGLPFTNQGAAQDVLGNALSGAYQGSGIGDLSVSGDNLITGAQQLQNLAGSSGSTTDFWTKLFTKVENVGARFGLIAAGVVVIGIGAFAAVHGEFGAGVQKMAKSVV